MYGKRNQRKSSLEAYCLYQVEFGRHPPLGCAFREADPNTKNSKMGSMIAAASGPGILLSAHTAAATHVFNTNTARYRGADVAGLQQRPPIGQPRASTAYANQGYYQGTVTSIEDVGGITTVQLANGSGQLLCGTAVVFWFDPTTPYGQSMLALALTAKALGSTVYVQGNGTCSTAWPYNNTEQLVAVSVSS